MSTGGHRRGFEETVIAIILGLMTVITFVNVILRYVFNHSLIWGLEVTLILFAWLVVFGISYAVRMTMHLGVDAITGMLKPGPRRVFALLALTVCLAYALLMMKGAWDYWAPYAGLWQTEGRWFPLGFDTGTRDRAFYVTDQVPMLGFLRFLEGWINMGEPYDKLPRVIPYIIMPIGMGMFLFRYIQVAIHIIRGQSDSLIVSHEMEEEVEAARMED